MDHLYYKSWNNWNPFSPRLGPPYPSRRTHLSAQRFDERGCRPTKLIEEKCFHQNPNTFYTKHFYLLTFVPTYYFLVAYTYFPLHIHWPIIYVIFSFGMIIIDIIIYGRKRKTYINVLLSFSIHILSFAHMLTYNSRHFLKRIIIDIIVYERKRKMCIIFRKKNKWHQRLMVLEGY